MNDKTIMLEEGMRRMSIEYDEKKTELLLEYMNIVLEENRKFNLTSITEEDEFIEKNILDSLSGLKWFKGGGRILDMGSGAGLPGLVLSVFLEDADFILADSLKKRVDFLNRTAERLGLVNVSAVHSRAEDLARDESFRDSFDFVTARAVARMNVLLEYTLPFLKPGGKFIAYKGLIAKEELSECAGALDELKGYVSGTCDFTLPFSEDRRTIAVISKTDATPSKYPRKPAKIRKKPL